MLACYWAQQYFLCPTTDKHSKKTWNVKSIVSQRLSHPFWKTFAAVFPDPTNRPWVFEYGISANLKLLGIA